ncbi:hypothetical protein [Streptomyces mirabilis]|uniref:hypothetical protein n=1 Tax=Streptomyces mirabilis TaxID=68239 RepID=UPI00340304EE
MAKGPAVIGVLTEPPKPTWWKVNRHKVLLVVGLLVGYWIGTHLHGAPASQPDTPSPGPQHTRPVDPRRLINDAARERPAEMIEQSGARSSVRHPIIMPETTDTPRWAPKLADR